MQEQNRKTEGKSYSKWLWHGLLQLAIALAISSVVIIFAYRFINPPLTWLMVERYFFKKETRFKPILQSWKSIEDISPNITHAFIAAEDNLFPTHFGFDFESIRKASNQNKQGKRMRGASTISMQVAKNVFLWHGRTWVRKGFEAGLTLLIETFWTKKRIMEVYTNIVELGPSVYGVQAASQKYLKKDASKVNIHEAALMASALPNPLQRNIAKPSKTMSGYQKLVLQRMKNIKRYNFVEVNDKKHSPEKEKSITSKK